MKEKTEYAVISYISLRKFLIIFVFVLSGVGLLLLLFPISYWANDNNGILNVIKLGYTAFFMSAILGRFLSNLYLHVSNGFPWYAVFLYLAHGLSITLFIYSLTLAIKDRILFFRVLLLYLAIYSLMIFRVGYNGASIMIGSNALLLFGLCILKIPDVGKRLTIVLGILFSFSYLIRERSVQAIVIFSIPAMLLLFFYMKRRRVLLTLLFLLPSILFIGFNHYYTSNYTSSTYRRYRDFNEVRGEFHDFTIATENMENEDILEANDWSSNDYMAFMYWFFPDEKIFGKEKVDNIFKYSVQRSRHDLSFDEYLRKSRVFLEKYWFYLAALIFILLAIALRASRRVLIPCLAYSLYSMGGILYLNLYYRFPLRIGLPIFLLVYSFLAFIYIVEKHYIIEADTISKKIPRPVFGVLLGVFYIALLFIATFKVDSYFERVRLQKKRVRNIVKTINLLPPESIVTFQPGRGIQLLYLSPLGDISIRSDIYLLTGGWNTFSERYYHQLSQAGVRKGMDLVTYLIESNRFYAVIADDYFKDCLDTYFREHYTGDVYWTQFATVSKRTIYWITDYETEMQKRRRRLSQPGKLSDKEPDKDERPQRRPERRTDSVRDR